MSDAAPADVPVDEPAPDWFHDAVAAPRREGVTEVDGCEIHHLAWGTPGRPAVVLVHGFLASAEWWSHIAPFLGVDHHVVAVDLAGHGDSGRREAYSLESWANDVEAVATATTLDHQPVLVGHSVGAYAAAVAASRRPERFGALLLCDPVLATPSPTPSADAAASALANLGRREFATFDEAVRRFRPMPPQADALEYVSSHIAQTSVIGHDGHWRWKFDPGVIPSAPQPPLPMRFPALECLAGPVAVLRSEHGLLPAELVSGVHEQLGRRAAVIELAQAGHHPMLDQPLALIAALRSILALWTNTRPARLATT